MNMPDLLYIGCLASWILATRRALTSKVRNRRAWRFTAVLLTAGLASLLTARCLGSSIDKDGFLHEPFFLIGSGSLLSVAGSCITSGLILRGLFCQGNARGDKSQAA